MSKAGSLADPKQVDNWLEAMEIFQRDWRCGAIFSNEALALIGYQHNYEAPGVYNQSKGVWIRTGLVKGLPQPIISAIKTLDDTTPADVIGSLEDGKYPGE